MNQATPASMPELPPEAIMTNLMFGPLMTQALYVAAKLGVADLLKDNSMSAAELAQKTETNENALYRILRSLSSIGIFQETESRTFAMTQLSELLRSDVPNSMRSGVIFMGEAWHWSVWGDLIHSVRTGEPAWAKILSKDVFDYFNQNPEAGEIFNNAMTDLSRASAFPVLEAYDFSGFETIADIAGGHGFMLAQILKANPEMKGILFDVPAVIAGADALLTGEGVNDRVEKVSGDFFKEVPSADAYIMKHIIHDWDDERCIKILQSIRRAMNGNGKVMLIETVVPEGNEPHYSKLLDLEMLVSPGGVERTEKEYAELFEKAGFKLTRIVPTKSPMYVVEAVKA